MLSTAARADFHYSAFVHIFINSFSSGLTAWAERYKIPAQRQALPLSAILSDATFHFEIWQPISLLFDIITYDKNIAMKIPVPEGDHHNPATVYVFHASHTRGVLLNQVILLERLMDKYISEYFCSTSEKSTELMDMILATKRITFDSKSQVFRNILDKLYPDKKKENSGIAKDFQFIAEERNMLAHYFLDVSPDLLSSFNENNAAFTLLKIEKTRTRELFDYKRVRRIGDMVTQYIEALNEMIQFGK